MKKSKESSTSRHKSKTPGIIITSLIFVLVLAVAGFLIYKAYWKGYEEGKIARTSETEADLTAIASALSEKTSLNKKISELFPETPADFTSENISEYKEKISALKDSVSLPEAKEKLSDLETSLDELKTIFDEKDNEKIQSKFDELKLKVAELGPELTDLYNHRVTEALKSLPHS